MTRAFAPVPVDRSVLDHLVDLAARSPSAGKTQGWHMVVLEGDKTAEFWDVTLPEAKRASFRWQHLLDAPVIALAFVDANAYTERYSEPDKAATGLGESADAWPVPYWTIDGSMAVMTFLLAAEDAGLGALFFGVFQREAELRERLGVPTELELLGAIALGFRRTDRAGSDDASPASSPGRSAHRPRRRPDEIVHYGRW